MGHACREAVPCSCLEVEAGVGADTVQLLRKQLDTCMAPLAALWGKGCQAVVGAVCQRLHHVAQVVLPS